MRRQFRRPMQLGDNHVRMAYEIRPISLDDGRTANGVEVMPDGTAWLGTIESEVYLVSLDRNLVDREPREWVITFDVTPGPDGDESWEGEVMPAPPAWQERIVRRIGDNRNLPETGSPLDTRGG